MIHLLQFEKVKPTSIYDSISYQSVAKVNDKVFQIYIERNAWKNTKYSVTLYHNNSLTTLGYHYPSAKKAMLNCQIYFNNLISKSI
jgi:hypothetical protein